MTRISSLLSTFTTVLLAGCARWAPYHPGLEQRVVRMDEHTSEMLASKRTHTIPAAESRSYIHDSLFALQWLHDDATEYREKGPEVEVIERVHTHFLALEARRKPLVRNDLLTVAGDISELRRYQVRKRTVTEWLASLPPASSDVDSSTPDTTTPTKKDADNHDSGGHDHKH